MRYSFLYFQYFLAQCHTSLSIDSFLSEPTIHSHAPDPECIPAFELKSQIKIKAMTSNEASSSILHSELRLMPLIAIGSLPKSDSLMRTIRDDNARRRV